LYARATGRSLTVAALKRHPISGTLHSGTYQSELESATESASTENASSRARLGNGFFSHPRRENGEADRRMVDLINHERQNAQGQRANAEGKMGSAKGGTVFWPRALLFSGLLLAGRKGGEIA